MKKQYYTIILNLVFLFLNYNLCVQIIDKELSKNNRIDDYLKKSANNGFSGSIIVSLNDSVIIKGGYGFANKEKQILNSPDIVYEICSASKQFTATAILKLVESNTLNLSDSLSMFLENIPNDKQWITIHQLLTHSAGFVHEIGDYDFDLMPTYECFNT